MVGTINMVLVDLLDDVKSVEAALKTFRALCAHQVQW